MNYLTAAALALTFAVALAWPAPATALSRIRVTHHLQLPPWLKGRDGAPALRRRLQLGGGTAVLLVLLIDGVLGLFLGLTVGAALVLLLGQRAPRPDTAQLAAELPDALEFLAICLEAGQPMPAAVTTVAEVSPTATRKVLREVAAQLRLGRAGPESWQFLRSHPVWGAAAAEIARAERSGASLTGALRVHAEDARHDFRESALKAARTVGVKSVVPLMACFLPAFMLIGVVPIVAGLIQNFFSG